jgi:hypothetical protein
MKKICLFISAMFGLMLASGVVMATCDNELLLKIRFPTEGSITNSSIQLVANVSNSYKTICKYTLDNGGVSPIMNGTESGTIYRANIADLTPGKHKIEVYCERDIACNYNATKTVEWSVEGNTTAVPEFPTAAIPVILSMLSFALVRKTGHENR